MASNNTIMLLVGASAAYYYYNRVYLPKKRAAELATVVQATNAAAAAKKQEMLEAVIADADSEGAMGMQPRNLASLTSHLPAVNPLASLTLQQRMGAINPVRFNEWHDIRGAPRVMVSNVIDEEQAFLKHPRAIDSYIDRMELRPAKGDRLAVFN